MNLAFWCFHNPAAVGLLARCRHRAKPLNFRTHLPGPGSIGLSHPGWINIAAIRLKHDTADAVKISQRMQRFGFLAAHLMKIHVEIYGLCGLQTQLMFAFFGLRKIK